MSARAPPPEALRPSIRAAISVAPMPPGSTSLPPCSGKLETET